MGFTINTVTLSGNLTRDPELRNLTNTSVTDLRIASHERVKDRDGNWSDRANYFDVTIWGGQGEWLSKNIRKGDSVVVKGRLRWREWESDGVKRQAVDIVADDVIPVPRDGSKASSSKSSSSSPAKPPEDDSDIPF